MGFVSLKSLRADSGRRLEFLAELKASLRSILSLGEDDCVSVSEVACADPRCNESGHCGSETIVLVMRAGERTRSLRIAKSLRSLKPTDLEEMASEERRRLVDGCA